MDAHYRLQIANRIHLGLKRVLGQGIEVEQLLRSELYARDVLLVCQAFPGGELQRLGEQFRQATIDASTAAAATPSGWAREGDDFGVCQPVAAVPNADFADAGSPRGPAGAARRWLSPSSWFTR